MNSQIPTHNDDVKSRTKERLHVPLWGLGRAVVGSKFDLKTFAHTPLTLPYEPVWPYAAVGGMGTRHVEI